MAYISSSFYKRLGRERGYKQGGAWRQSYAEGERECPMQIRCSKKWKQCYKSVSLRSHPDAFLKQNCLFQLLCNGRRFTMEQGLSERIVGHRKLQGLAVNGRDCVGCYLHNIS